ncbi:MAG: hypothetical protein NTW26_03055 [bacterium]|nr:hypothetical protein [bacterium]
MSLRRDYGPDESLSPDEPDAVLAGNEIFLFGLPDGWRRLTLDEVHAVRSRSRVVFGPWRLVAAMLVPSSSAWSLGGWPRRKVNPRPAGR